MISGMYLTVGLDHHAARLEPDSKTMISGMYLTVCVTIILLGVVPIAQRP
jgi:hypothetical protein